MARGRSRKPPWRRLGADVRAVSGHGEPVPWRRNPGRVRLTPCVSTGCRRWSSCCADSSACCQGSTASAICDATSARGLVTPRMRREFYGLIPAYVFAMLLVSVSNNLGIMWIAVELTTLASVFLDHVSRYRTPRSRPHGSSWCWAASASALRCSGPCSCSRPGKVRSARAWRALHWTRFMQVAPRAASIYAAARRRVCPHRLRDQGWSGADAHVEARRVSRSAVASRGADGGRHVERRAVLRPADPSDFEGRVGTGVLGGAAADARPALRADRDAVHLDSVEYQAAAGVLQHRARRHHGHRRRTWCAKRRCSGRCCT